MTPPTKKSCTPPSTILATNAPLSIVLVEPRIPQNTGNISRLCACTGVDLFLVGDLGFRLSDKLLKRSGMDYMDRVTPIHLQSFEALTEEKPGWQPVYLSTKATQSHWEYTYQPNSLLVFGSETQGLPEWVITENPGHSVRIPMAEGARSLNLASSTAIVLYEALRQINTSQRELLI
ncbi:MAG: tRNA (cytidine(34)-2'-O)-methyltransferase [Vampirovibrio sp.]|nr:tRNA (cytidine(34)-2'-O)-methyltransferase [Vampirovibrio sp.]